MSAKSDAIRLNELFESINLDLLHRTGASLAKEFARERLIQRMRKRARFVKPELQDQAIDKFKSVNLIMKEAASRLPCDIENAAREFIRHVLEKHMKALEPDSLQECFSWSFVLGNWAFGPGASNGVKGTGTVEKIDQAMTCTEDVEPYVKLIRSDYIYFQSLDAHNGNDGVSRVYGSRLTTVLKNEDSVRTIAIEPSGNMAFQLAGGRFIEGALARIGLDITDQQPKNKNLARLGSLYGDLCTIDMSSASDMISIPLIESLWPREWFAFFMRFRSPVTELPSGETITLNMMSTMGNGYTFPMMTLTFLALVYANRLVNFSGPTRYVDWRYTAVFGDDIIVPSHEYDALVDTLEQACFIVNKDKSYSVGPFRESCGGDYYEGIDVTPFYVKSVSKPPEIYVALNQVLRWGARHGFPMFNTLRRLLSWLPSRPYLVPEWADDFSGIRTSQCPRDYKKLMVRPVKRRYSGAFTVPLACAGYILWEDGVVYQPRVDWVRYSTGRSKLPKGYLDGWDPSYGTSALSSQISLMVSLVT